MRVLIIKMSSLGDVIHTLPALTEAKQHCPDVTFDWVVESGFAEIVHLHFAVENVFKLPFRAWRKKWWHFKTNKDFFGCLKKVMSRRYDLIIDAQGLLKSALIGLLVKGPVAGYDRFSIKEPLASFFYSRKIQSLWEQHAIIRTRQLFAKSLGYVASTQKPDYGLKLETCFAKEIENPEPYCVFLHGTTWQTKHWPEIHWKALAKKVSDLGFGIKLPWGNSIEKKRAIRIAASIEQAVVLPKMNLIELLSVIHQAKAVVCVDTGLGHLTAALKVPHIGLYGPTCAKKVGTQATEGVHLVPKLSCAPCFKRVCPKAYQDCFDFNTPERVVEKLTALLCMQQTF